jgi:enolase
MACRQNTSYRPLFLILISGQIKTGSLWRSERNGRYNLLMEIAIRVATRSLASRR